MKLTQIYKEINVFLRSFHRITFGDYRALTKTSQLIKSTDHQGRIDWNQDI